MQQVTPEPAVRLAVNKITESYNFKVMLHITLTLASTRKRQALQKYLHLKV